MEYNGKIPSSANTFRLICTIYTFIYLPLLTEKNMDLVKSWNCFYKSLQRWPRSAAELTVSNVGLNLESKKQIKQTVHVIGLLGTT